MQEGCESSTGAATSARNHELAEHDRRTAGSGGLGVRRLELLDALSDVLPRLLHRLPLLLPERRSAHGRHEERHRLSLAASDALGPASQLCLLRSVHNSGSATPARSRGPQRQWTLDAGVLQEQSTPAPRLASDKNFPCASATHEKCDLFVIVVFVDIVRNKRHFIRLAFVFLSNSMMDHCYLSSFVAAHLFWDLSFDQEHNY
ncbi:hypothetical protein C0J52_01451 [Blattella germanica]|nr:hypothetical protein C0J52_01451 [Blattella germanica]